MAKAQQSAAEAQELSFEYQKQLANFSKFLLGLGARNMTINRALSRSLEMKMKGASEKELDNLAQQEFLSVIKQLKDQEDIMLKQEDLSKIVRGHDEELKQQDNTLRRQAAKDAEHDKLFQEKARKDKAQDEELKRQAYKDAEHDKLFQEKARKDKSQDEELKRQAAKDAEHDRLFKEKAQKDKSQDEELKRQAAKDAEHDRLLAEKTRKDDEQDIKLGQLSENNAEQDNQIAALQRQTEEQAQQIGDMQQVNTKQAQEIAELQECCAALEKRLVEECEKRLAEDHNLATVIDLKAAKTANTASIAIGAVALISALIQFFI